MSTKLLGKNQDQIELEPGRRRRDKKIIRSWQELSEEDREEYEMRK